MIPIEVLKPIPFFAGMKNEDLTEIAHLFFNRRLKGGEVLFKQGTLGDALYVLQTGTLRVRHQSDQRNSEHTLRYLNPPSSFGEREILSGLRRDVTADVISTEATLWFYQKSNWIPFCLFVRRLNTT